MMQTGAGEGIMRYVPTAGKLKRMYAMTRPSRFTVNGAHALSVIGVCLCIMGIEAFLLGQRGGTQGRPVVAAEPEATQAAAVEEEGEAVRQRSGVGAASGMARVVQTGSLFLIVVGLLIAFRPHILYYELKRCGLAGGRGAQYPGGPVP